MQLKKVMSRSYTELKLTIFLILKNTDFYFDMFWRLSLSFEIMKSQKLFKKWGLFFLN